jgi:hypothetical protein
VDTQDIGKLTAVTAFIREIRRAMERQGCDPVDIAQAIAMILKQYNLILPDKFVKESPYQQMTMTLSFGN